MPRAILADMPLDVQRDLLIRYDTGGMKNLRESKMARILNITPRLLKQLLENREAIESQLDENDFVRRFRRDGTQKALLEETNGVLFQCFVKMTDMNLPMDDTILLVQAQRIAAQLGVRDYVPDVTWLRCWKESRRIPDERLYKRSADTIVAECCRSMNQLVSHARLNYAPEDVYCLVEMGVHFVVPAGVVAANGGGPPNAEPDRDVRTLCALFVCNVSGTDKRSPLLIEKFHQFSGTNPTPDAFNINFHMLRTNEYRTFIRRLDRDVGPRKILLVLDNFSKYPAMKLKNIEIKLLPKGFVHPLGMKLLSYSGAHERYRQIVLQEQPPDVDDDDTWHTVGSVFVQAFLYGWRMVSPTNIRNCCRTLYFLTTDFEEENSENPENQQQRPSVITHTSFSQ